MKSSDTTNPIVDFRVDLKSYKLIKHIFSLITVVLLTVSSCTSAPPLIVNIKELSACKGWDKTGKPMGISKMFFTTEKRIFACGYLQTNDPPITLSVNWYHEDRLIFRETIKDVKDYFYSSIEPTEEFFQEGNYKIEVVVGKKPVQKAEFFVKQP